METDRGHIQVYEANNKDVMKRISYTATVGLDADALKSFVAGINASDSVGTNFALLFLAFCALFAEFISKNFRSLSVKKSEREGESLDTSVSNF